ncbi:MAG: hypothetical protein JNN20_11335 [Betaproteobacteria bacterium]|nr:hypothetical protein [Betaproteobacteria bacterium]
MRRVALIGGLLLASASCLASNSSSSFGVNIALAARGGGSDSSGICVSETLSAETNAQVQVVCRTGQFVDIQPVPGRPFAGVHGGAFRFHFSNGSLQGVSPDTADMFSGVGTVTGMRIYHADGRDGPLELLVSF